MRQPSYLSREQIAALSIDELGVEYEKAKRHFDTLLSYVETNNALKVPLQAQINAARIQYVLLRSREYSPVYFRHLKLAA
ncbi:hypothetical protein GO730_05585 [Spirosoma sp. HMF3257]|uniref:DUF2508 family protein n=1 Tax=Spirosoma telluris TaxID=2183553 RepID=A0A327NI15_9BACT|nr:hypothetical protein [Spirosoma telluris]RAI73949.1 hypothetical protein HMF3257_05555 [Spirosoma telluris]